MNHPVSLRVNRSGSNYTDKDDWFSCLEKMCAFEFTDISYEYPDGDTWKKKNLDYSIVINAFNPLQAERIFQWTMYTWRTAPGVWPDKIHCSMSVTFVRNLSYRLGRAWERWNGCLHCEPDGSGWFSDCDPGRKAWKDEPGLYESMVIRCLAFQRSLIPEAERGWFGDKINPAEKFPSEYDPEWKAERTGEFNWTPVRTRR